MEDVLLSNGNSADVQCKKQKPGVFFNVVSQAFWIYCENRPLEDGSVAIAEMPDFWSCLSQEAWEEFLGSTIFRNKFREPRALICTCPMLIHF